tara:strand:+ start:487 stop:1395 length:909 start_codon:yes stop_codon:yes gene_type:complete
MQDFSAIPIFIAVVEEKSFSRAAERLGITTSAVSKRVSGLEAKLNVKLLTRTTRKLSLTESGSRYFEYAQQAMLAMQDAENAALEKKDVPSGTLRVSAPVTFGRRMLASMVPQFLKENPLVSIQIEMSDVFSKVNIEDFDIILSTGNIPSTSYKAIKILNVPGVVCASPEYLAARSTPEQPAELVNHNCLLLSFHHVADEWVFIKDDEETKVKVSGNYSCNNPEAVHKSALAGLGITCLPSNLVIEDLSSGSLVPLFEDYTIPPRIFRAIYPEKRFQPAKVRVFIEFLINNLGGEKPDWDLF